MASWTDIKQRWSDGWKAMHRAALSKLGVAIKANPQKFKPHVEATLADLKAARTHLERIKAQIPRLPDAESKRKYAAVFQAGWKRYHELAAGLYADAEQVKKAEQGQTAQVSGFVIPLLVVAGIAFGVAAIAWAVASREHSKNLREQTALADHELTARVEASKEGRVLQETTLPEQPAAASLLPVAAPTVGSKSKVGLALVGVLALAAAGMAVPMFLKR